MTVNEFECLQLEEKLHMVDNSTLVKLETVEFSVEKGMLISYKAFNDKVTAVYPVFSSLWPFCKTCQTLIILSVDKDGKYCIDNTSNHESMWINNPPISVELSTNPVTTTFALEIAKMFQDTV